MDSRAAAKKDDSAQKVKSLWSVAL